MCFCCSQTPKDEFLSWWLICFCLLIQKEVKLRQVVLEKCEGLIKKTDLPWEDMDLTVPFVDILVIVIDSYDE